MVVGRYGDDEISLAKLNGLAKGDMNVHNLVVPVQGDLVPGQSLILVKTCRFWDNIGLPKKAVKSHQVRGPERKVSFFLTYSGGCI